jgi:4-hydroxybenzoyl-CoA thioesterase
MARVVLVEQEQYAFHYPVRIEPRHLSIGNHLGSDNLILLASAARADVFQSMGLTQVDLGDGVTGIIIADIVVTFKAEAFLHDEIVIDTHFGAFTGHSFTAFQRIRNGDKVLAIAETGLVTFNYRSRKIVRVPERLLHTVAAHHSNT